MVHWTDRRRAKARIAEALMDRAGWDVFGYTEDRSDAMTDYYAPASWQGVARHASGAVLCVDCSDARKSGWEETRQELRDGPCSGCDGSGRALRAVHAVVTRTIMPGGAVSEERTPEIRVGDPCQHCSGTGAREEYRAVGTGRVWPTFSPNPGRASWHIERDGRVIASGVGVFSAASWSDAKSSATLDALLRRFDAAVFAPPPSVAAGASGAVLSSASGAVLSSASGAGFVLRPGLRPGYVEIEFAVKPEESVRTELKSGGFRWAKSGCWYGLADRLPARYRSSVPA